MPRVLEMTYGDRIRRARLDAGLTQEEYAAEIGTTQATLGAHELMAHPPLRNRRGVASMIQVRYGVDADWLLTGEGEVTRENFAVAA